MILNLTNDPIEPGTQRVVHVGHYNVTYYSPGKVTIHDTRTGEAMVVNDAALTQALELAIDDLFGECF